MVASELEAMQSESPTFGESLDEPFYFLQQVFNSINT